MGKYPELIRDDGTLWRASYGSECGAIACLFDNSLPQYFFRQVTKNPAKKWWSPWRLDFIDTGETWEGHNLKCGGFSVYNEEASDNA